MKAVWTASATVWFPVFTRQHGRSAWRWRVVCWARNEAGTRRRMVITGARQDVEHLLTELDRNGL